MRAETIEKNELLGTSLLSADKPINELPRTAQKILIAAREIALSEGLEALSFANIAKLSGENRASITYHFGNKSGLMATLIDSFSHDVNIDIIEKITGFTEDDPFIRLNFLIARQVSVIKNIENTIAFFEIFPLMFHDSELRDDSWSKYQGHFALFVQALGGDSETDEYILAKLNLLARVLVSVSDGLSGQYRMMPTFPAEEVAFYTSNIAKNLFSKDGKASPDISVDMEKIKPRTLKAKLPTKEAKRLSPTAGKILEASRRIILERGMFGLSFATISTESGENRASVSYHFGNKRGLISAVISSLAADSNKELVEEIGNLPRLDDRIAAFIEVLKANVRDMNQSRIHIELIPIAVRNEILHESISALYQEYIETFVLFLQSGESSLTQQEVQNLARYILGLVEGLSMQYVLHQDDYVVDEVMAVLALTLYETLSGT